MPAVTIRNLSDQTHRSLKARAASNHRSTEAEIRAILDAAAEPALEGLGTALFRLGQKYGGIELETDLPGDEPRPVDFS